MPLVKGLCFNGSAAGRKLTQLYGLIGAGPSCAACWHNPRWLGKVCRLFRPIRHMCPRVAARNAPPFGGLILHGSNAPMADLTPDIAGEVIAACRTGAEEITASLSRALDGQMMGVTIGEAATYDPQSPAGWLRQAGSAILFQFGDVGTSGLTAGVERLVAELVRRSRSHRPQPAQHVRARAQRGAAAAVADGRRVPRRPHIQVGPRTCQSRTRSGRGFGANPSEVPREARPDELDLAACQTGRIARQGCGRR